MRVVPGPGSLAPPRHKRGQLLPPHHLLAPTPHEQDRCSRDQLYPAGLALALPPRIGGRRSAPLPSPLACLEPRIGQLNRPVHTPSRGPPPAARPASRRSSATGGRRRRPGPAPHRARPRCSRSRPDAHNGPDSRPRPEPQPEESPARAVQDQSPGSIDATANPAKEWAGGLAGPPCAAGSSADNALHLEPSFSSSLSSRLTGRPSRRTTAPPAPPRSGPAALHATSPTTPSVKNASRSAGGINVPLVSGAARAVGRMLDAGFAGGSGDRVEGWMSWPTCCTRCC